MRILDEKLIEAVLDAANSETKFAGFYFKRSIKFQGSLVKFGGARDLPVLRMWDSQKGICDDRLMDEKIVVDGPSALLDGCLTDDNLNDLPFWINKHIKYASLEAQEFKKRLTLDNENKPSLLDALKRPDVLRSYLRENVYYKTLPSLRVIFYLAYRLFIKAESLIEAMRFFFIYCKPGFIAFG